MRLEQGQNNLNRFQVLIVQTLKKKKDKFVHNIPPRQCDPYSCSWNLGGTEDLSGLATLVSHFLEFPTDVRMQLGEHGDIGGQQV